MTTSPRKARKDIDSSPSSLLIRCNTHVVVITSVQLHSIKPELRFCTGLNPARDVSEFRYGEDLWQWFRLEIRLVAFCRLTISQKQFIIIIITPWRITSTIQTNVDHHFLFLIRIPILYLVMFWSILLIKPMFWLQQWNWFACCSWIYFFFNFVPTPNKSLRFTRFRKSYVNHDAFVLTIHCHSYAAFHLDVRCSKLPGSFLSTYFCWAYLLPECCQPHGG